MSATQDASLDALIRKLQNSVVNKAAPAPPHPSNGSAATASVGVVPPAVPPKPKIRARAGPRFQLPSTTDANTIAQATSSVTFETKSSSVVAPPLSSNVDVAAHRATTDTNGEVPEDANSSDEETGEFDAHAKEINDEEVSRSEL